VIRTQRPAAAEAIHGHAEHAASLLDRQPADERVVTKEEQNSVFGPATAASHQDREKGVGTAALATRSSQLSVHRPSDLTTAQRTAEVASAMHHPYRII
jgi:hypothetical protein